MQSLVSVIVPINNCDPYISICVDSILKQTYDNIEVLLLCKNISENALKICKYYEKKDERVRIIKTEKDTNIKNVGLSKAKGEYITFVDGGDTVTSNYIEYLLELAKKEKADIVCARSYINGNKVKKITYYETFEKKEIMENYMHMKFNSDFYAKLYKASLFEDLDYPNVKYYDDFMLGYKLFDKSKVLVNSTLEIYSLNPYKREHDIEDYDYMKKIGACFDMLTFIEEKYPSLTKYCKTKICFEALDLFRVVRDKDYRKQLYSYVKLYRKYAINDERIDTSKKILCMRSVLGYQTMRFIYNIEELLKKPIN